MLPPQSLDFPIFLFAFPNFLWCHG